jgi:superfamily I DNA and/or RNA helicase
METAILSSAWSKVKIDFPKLTDFTWEQLYNKTVQSIKTEKQENEEFAHFLIQEQKKQFEYYSTLLRTPMQKLTAEEKELKQQLKNGKRILIKEFSKSRNHSSIRSLMDTEAQIWIHLLKPIWLVNPARMATCFPLKQSLFQVAIFDEASQIPFEHALGTLQRVNRILVAGDPQQMSPSNYFSSTTESVDLLHQAHYYLPSHFLSYHYRSQHPALIEFSNRYFYENRLIAFQHATYKGSPIDFQYIENGFFENNVNKTEAEKVADYISLRINSTDSIGIAAFSESQLACIYSFLSTDTKNKLQQRIELDEVFFKAVENIQGDECDELILSFGYGYTEKEGQFNMRFGPINFSSGPKRLNVLFSRARKKISFFASVQSTDFKPHNNEAVELLRKWFLQMEVKTSFRLEEQLSMSFKSLVESNSNALAINTLLSVYQEREWIINPK